MNEMKIVQLGIDGWRLGLRCVVGRFLVRSFLMRSALIRSLVINKSIGNYEALSFPSYSRLFTKLHQSKNQSGQVKIVTLSVLLASGLSGGLGYFLGHQQGEKQGIEVGVQQGIAQQVKTEAQRDKFSTELASGRLSKRLDVDMNALKARIADIKAEAQKLNIKVEAPQADIDQALQSVQEGIAALPPRIEPEVSLPADSPSARVLAQPKTPGGVSQPVANSFEHETGIPSAEIDTLMNQ